MGREIRCRSRAVLQRLRLGFRQAHRYVKSQHHKISSDGRFVSELGVDRDDTGFARLVKKAAEEGKPLDKVTAPGGGSCPFTGTTSKGRQAKL